MKRIHIHISVDDLDKNIDFYSALFGNEPTTLKSDYAKWQLDDPVVNFAISDRGSDKGLNHLGIEVEHAEELEEVSTRLDAIDADKFEEKGASCCYAESDKYWTLDPQGIPWENFNTLGDVPLYGDNPKKDVAFEKSCYPTINTQPSGCC